MRLLIGIRNSLMISLVLWAILIKLVFAQDITQAEVIPDVAVWKLDTVKILAFSSTAKIIYRKVDAEGKATGREKKIIFRNIPDNPATHLVDETSNEFNQLINLINKESNIKQSITKAVRIKLKMD